MDTDEVSLVFQALASRQACRCWGWGNALHSICVVLLFAALAESWLLATSKARSGFCSSDVWCECSLLCLFMFLTIILRVAKTRPYFCFIHFCFRAMCLPDAYPCRYLFTALDPIWHFLALYRKRSSVKPTLRACFTKNSYLFPNNFFPAQQSELWLRGIPTL